MKNARFFAITLGVSGDNIPVITENPDNPEAVTPTRTMTVTGGNYSYWNGKSMIKHATGDAAVTFNLGTGVTQVAAGFASNDAYFPLPEYLTEEEFVPFLLSADGGLNGATVSWTFSDAASVNGNATVPNFKTTEEQLKGAVPYIKPTYNGETGRITKIEWRMVLSSDLETAVSLDYPIDFVAYRGDSNGEGIIGSINQFVAIGDVASGSVTFATPINSLWPCSLYVRTYDDNSKSNPKLYEWRYVNVDEEVVENFIEDGVTFNANIKDRKSDYTYIEKRAMGLGVASVRTMFEAKYLTHENKFNLPAGKYNVIYTGDGGDAITQKEVESTADNPISFNSVTVSRFGENYIEYVPYDLETGKYISFLDDLGDSLSNTKVTISYPNEAAVIVDSADYPDYDTQQFWYLPSFELISNDEGYITSIKYTVIASDETKPPFDRDDMKFKMNVQVRGASGSPWVVENETITKETTLELPNPYKYDDLYDVFVVLMVFYGDKYEKEAELLSKGISSSNATLKTSWIFSNELPKAMIIPTELSSDVLNNVVEAVDDISNADEISAIEINELDTASHVTETAQELIENESADVIGSLNKITISDDGCGLLSIK